MHEQKKFLSTKWLISELWQPQPNEQAERIETHVTFNVQSTGDVYIFIW